MSHRDEYTQFLGGLHLRHFAPSEIVNYADRVRDGVRNSLPPRRLWPNLVPTLWVADQLRHHLGFALAVVSAYRDEDYNAAVGGAPSSLHKENSALDLKPIGGSVMALHAAAMRFRGAGVFRGGIGLYNTFVHIDTRGADATW